MDRVEVSLQDILTAIGGPLEEKALWALLHKSCLLLNHELREHSGMNVDLLITPETVTLQHKGSVHFPRGIIDPNSNFQAPEAKLKQVQQLNQQQQEKSYVYSLGITLFTAMQYGLDSNQAPQVGEDMNKVLVDMVDEDEGERISLAAILSFCQKWTSEKDSTSEVDRLVSYVMGTEEELELSMSEQGDADELIADDANLEMEIKEVMNIRPTGSVEHLYSPSYGSRGSSLSIHSAAGNLQRNASFDSGSADIQLQYSSMPMVYFSSEDRLNKAHRNSASDNDSLSSFDRLATHLQPHEIDILASKAKGVPHSQASHYYTPTRTRKHGYKDVNRSASFEHGSLGIYRSSSDGTKRNRGKVNESLPSKSKKRKEDVPKITTSTPEKVSSPLVKPGVNVLSLDDMPPLPPTTAVADVSMDSPTKTETRSSPQPNGPSTVEKIDSILQSIERRKSDEEIDPPPLPSGEPPMFTPIKNPEEHRPKSADTNSSFDYTELGSPPRTPHSVADGENFNFSSPPPIPVSSPPQDEERGPVDEPVAVAVVQPVENVAPVVEGWKDGSIDRTITPRRALDEAFKQLDMIGESQLDDSEDNLVALYATVDKAKQRRMKKETVADEDGTKESPEEHVYATVDKSQKGKGSGSGQEEDDKEEEDEPPPIPPYTEPVEASTIETAPPSVSIPPVDPGYEDIEFDGKIPDKKPPVSTTEEPGYASIEDVMKRPATGDYSEIHTKVTLEGADVPKASSEANVNEVAMAVVHHPQRASMPPEVSSGGDPDYEPVKPLPVKRDTLSMPSDEERKKASLRKLQTVFGPEFTKLSGGPFSPPPTSPTGKTEQRGSVIRNDSMVMVPEGRRLIKVIMLTGKSVKFVVDRDSKCSELFQQVVSHQSLQEKRIFGLAVLRDRDEIFLDQDRKLSKYAPEGWKNTPVPPPGTKGSQPPVFSVFFRVQYYVENAITDLKLPQTRHQLYRQLRKDTVEGKMYCHEESALKLAAYALQAEKGDYLPAYENKPYFKLEEFVPAKTLNKLGTTKAKKALQAIHAEQKGKSKEDAELSFLKEAQTLPEYGMVFYRVSRTKSSPLGEVWLGFCIRGIVVYDFHKDVRTPVVRSSWSTTENISFANRKFVVEPQNSKPLTFFTQSYKRARYLLHLSVSYHRFQLVSRGPLEHIEEPASSALIEPAPIQVSNPGHRTLIKHSSTVAASLAGEPQKIANLFLSKGFISEETKEEITQLNVTKLLNGEKLLDALLREVKHFPHKYNEFITILEKDTTRYGDLLALLDVTYKKEIGVDGGGPADDSKRFYTPTPNPQGDKDEDGDIHEVRLLKEKGKGLGMRITTRSSPDGRRKSVVIESVEKDGPAGMDGRIKKGDVLLSAEGQPLEGLDHKEVGEILKKSSDVVKLSIKRRKTSESSPPLAPPTAHTESVVVEIEEEHTSPDQPRELKRTTTLEIHSTPQARNVSDLSITDQSTQSLELMNVTVDRGDRKSFGFAIAAGDFEGVVVLRVTPEGSAHQAGLKPGDRILSINGTDVENEDYNEILSIIQKTNMTLNMGIARAYSPHMDNLPPGRSSFVELKKQEGSLGLRIAGGKDKPNGLGYIYVKSVVEGSPADLHKLEEKDIVLMVNDESLTSLTHKEAAEIISKSGKNVTLRVHRPFDHSWLEPSRKAYLASRKGMAREESSTALFMHSRPLSIVGTPVDLSSIQEDQETQSTPVQTQRNEQYSTEVLSLKESDVQLEFSNEPAVPVTPPALPKEDPPLESGHEKVNEDILSSVSKPPPSPSSPSQAECLSDDNVEPVLAEKKQGNKLVVELEKGVWGGLGFGLDRSLSGQQGRGVFVKSVSENGPAKADGRIQFGDEVIKVNDKNLIDLSHQDAMGVLRDTVAGTVTLVIRRGFTEEEEEEEEIDEQPPIPPDSPLPPESSAHLNTQEQSSSVPLLEDQRPDSKETQVPELPVSPLPPQESTTSIETEPPAIPVSPLPPQESTTSLEIEPPVPPMSPLPQESVTSLNIESSVPPQESITSLETEPPNPPLSPLPPESITSLDIGLEDKAEAAVEPKNENMVVELCKGFRGLGFGLDKALSGQQGRGVFVKSVSDNGPAKKDGRIQIGDEVIQVNDKTLIGVSHKDALAVLRDTLGTVTLVIRRDFTEEEKETSEQPPIPPVSPLPDDTQTPLEDSLPET